MLPVSTGSDKSNQSVENGAAMESCKFYIQDQRIAYFSMEIGLSADIPTYSGGLGVLAGDTIKSAADLRIPLVAVTLIYRKGYFRQQFTADGWQQEYDNNWDPARHMELLPRKAMVSIDQRDVKIQAWLYKVKSPAGGEVPVLFLDTDIPGNDDRDRTLTDHLYGGDAEMRLKQEIILGIGHGDEAERWRDTQGHDRAQTQMLRVVRDVAEALGEDFAELYKEGSK